MCRLQRVHVLLSGCRCVRVAVLEAHGVCRPILRPVASRDLKPENVLLTKGCAGILIAKLGDLGMAQWVPTLTSTVACV